MDKVTIGESTLKDFGNVLNEAADILNKGKVAFDNSLPDKTLQVLPYTGQAGALIPSKIGNLDDLTTTAKDNLVNAINEVNNSLSSNTNVVTLDTEQTITGNKFFQKNTLAGEFIKIYPTPTEVIGAEGKHIAQLSGSILVGNDDSGINSALVFSVQSGRSVRFSPFSSGRMGGVAFEDSSSSQGFHVNYEAKLLGTSLNNLEGSFFNDYVSPNDGSALGNSCMGLGRITDGNNEAGAFIATPYNLYITLADSTSELVLNDKAKSEFQRVLEVPSTANLIDQSTAQSIHSEKTFTVPPLSTTTPSNANHMTNKAYVDSVGNAKVALTGNQTIAGNKTFSGATTTAALTANGAVTAKSTLAVTGNTTIAGTLTANGAIALNGSTTFKLIPNCAVKPTGNNHMANKLYVDNLGGVVSSGAAIDFRKGNHFVINLSANAQISVANWGGIAGKTGTITVLNANRITGFKAPFNFRTAQSGFTGTEVFSYYCYSSGLIRLVRS